MTWISFITKIAAFLTSTWAIPFYGAMFAWAGMEVQIHKHWRPIGYAMAGAGITFGSAWAVTYFYGAGGGGGTFAEIEAVISALT